MKKIQILLADDDIDDCLFFGKALEGLALSTHLSLVSDGEELVQFLANNNLPDALFLDLNMPKKTGFQCLKEIKNNIELHKIPVLIISTSYNPTVAESLYKNGASYFIEKPINPSDLSKLISQAIDLIIMAEKIRPEKEHFLLKV